MVFLFEMVRQKDGKRVDSSSLICTYKNLFICNMFTACSSGPGFQSRP